MPLCDTATSTAMQCPKGVATQQQILTWALCLKLSGGADTFDIRSDRL